MIIKITTNDQHIIRMYLRLAVIMDKLLAKARSYSIYSHYQ